MNKSNGFFDYPLFEGPKSRDLSRVGVIDVGSNSVRLVVFDGAARSPAYFYNEKIMCGLGGGLALTGHLNPQGRERALAALHRFVAIGQRLDLPHLSAVATAAVRDASDGPDFVAQVARETGLNIRVIDGQEEARLSAQGVLLGWPGSYGLVCDIGGASMELAEIADGQVGKRVTSDLGPLKLMDIEGGKPARQEVIKTTIKTLADQIGPQSDRLFLVGGSWRAIARLDMERRKYPLQVLHEYRMQADDVRKTARFIANHTLGDLGRRCGISSQRMAMVPIALEVLKALLKRFAPYDIAVSSYGIREGMLYEQMPDNLRQRDPLIEACRFAERKDARLPGFGRRLYKFVKPLFRMDTAERKRLILAACYLHDVSWRAHPDYRAESCFDYVTRANLGGIRHSERVFLGVALLYRYSNSPKGERFGQIIGLLSEADHQCARVLGKAMRLGAMLWADPDDETVVLRWAPKRRVLELKISPSTRALFGEVAQSRFSSLTQTLEAKEKITLLD